MQHYDVAGLAALAAGRGASARLLILCGIVCQVVQLVVSIRHRDALRDATGDPWDGRSLEWATASPPPAFNFAVLPDVEGEEAYWGDQAAGARARPHCATSPTTRPIEMPRNSPTGFVCAFFATVIGFALIWHIWWLVDRSASSAPSPPSWSSPGATSPNTRSRPTRSRGSTAPTGARGAALAAAGGRDVSADRDRCRPARDPYHRGAARAWHAAHAGTARPGAEADRRRLRLLDLPAQRHRHVLGLLRRLRGAARADRGRPGRRAAVRPAQRRARDRAACCSRASPAAWRASPLGARNAAAGSRSRWPSPSCSALAFLALEVREFADLVARGAGPDAQRLPVGLLHAGRLPRRCTSPPACSGC